MNVTATASIPIIDVPLIAWPSGEADRRHFAAEGRPRLLVVDTDSVPPTCVDELEDWVRYPVDLVDVVARTTALRQRAERRQERPVLDQHGLLWRHGQWVSIPPAQSPVMELLIERRGQMVSPFDLRAAYVAGGGSGDAVALKAAIARLARRIAPLGLRLHNIPGRGSLLEIVEM
jgi:hypothetical protein